MAAKRSKLKPGQIVCPVCDHTVWLRKDDGLIQQHQRGDQDCPASDTTPPAESLR